MQMTPFKINGQMAKEENKHSIWRLLNLGDNNFFHGKFLSINQKRRVELRRGEKETQKKKMMMMITGKLWIETACLIYICKSYRGSKSTFRTGQRSSFIKSTVAASSPQQQQQHQTRDVGWVGAIAKSSISQKSLLGKVERKVCGAWKRRKAARL